MRMNEALNAFASGGGGGLGNDESCVEVGTVVHVAASEEVVRRNEVVVMELLRVVRKDLRT